MSSERTGQTQSNTKQQNKQQESEVQVEQKDNLNTPPQHLDLPTQSKQQNIQIKSQVSRKQQGQSSSREQVGMDQNTKNISHQQQVKDKNQQAMIKAQAAKQQIQGEPHKSHSQYLQANTQEDRNIQNQFQKSVSIIVTPDDNQEQSIQKLEKSNKIQFQNRLEIQTTTLMEQKKKLGENLALAQTQLSFLEQKHKEEIQKARADVKNKDLKIQELQNRVTHYTQDLQQTKKDLKQSKGNLESQKQKTKQAQLDHKQFQFELGQYKQKNQQYQQQLRQINNERDRLAAQNQNHIYQNNLNQTQLNRLTSNNGALISEKNNLHQQITKLQSELSDKNHHITILIEKNKLLQQFQHFKLKQECELSALTVQIKNTSEQNSNKLKDYVAQFKNTTQGQLKAINSKIYSDYTNNLQNLKKIKQQYKQNLIDVQQLYRSCIEDLSREKQILYQQQHKLIQQSQELQQTSASLLKHSYTQIDSLRQELARLHNVCYEAEQGHQKEKYQMMETICQYSKQVSTLQAQLQTNAIIQIEKDFKQQNDTNRLSDKYQSTQTQFDVYKFEKQQKVRQLKEQLQSLKKQLSTNIMQAQKRQKRIIDSLDSFCTASQKQKDQCYNYTDKNKNILIQELNQLLLINQNVYESKMMLKTSQLKQLAQNYRQLESEFQNYKQKTLAELSELYTERYQLQQKLGQTQQVKESKIMIENEYATKEDILNNIIFILDSKKDCTLGDVIGQFVEQDTKREFRSLVEILMSVSQRTKKIEEDYSKVIKKLDSINKNYVALQRQKNEAIVRNEELERLVETKQKILNQEKNKYVQMSTKQIQLMLDLQGKQVEITQLKKKIGQLVNHNQKIIQDNQQQHKLSQIQKQKNVDLSNEIARMKLEKTVRSSDDNRNMLSSIAKRSEQEIQRYREEIRRYKQQCIKNKSLIDQLQSNVRQERNSAQYYKEQLQIAQNKNRQTMKKAASQIEYRSLEQQLAQNIQKINQLSVELTKKRKELEDANQTIKKYQLQLKSQKQKEPSHKMLSPVVFSSPEKIKSMEKSKSPLKFQLKDSPFKPPILDFGQELFKESNIVIMGEDEDFIKNTVQKYSGKKCVSAELKFKMQLSKPDFQNEAKNALSLINMGNLVWIFKKENEVFGAVSFSKGIKQQQSALLFNLSKKKAIYPANTRNSWIPVKSDTFFLTFGVQQARYIWKSRMFSIGDLKGIKYFDINTPLVGNFVSKQKFEVQQLQIFLLDIQK